MTEISRITVFNESDVRVVAVAAPPTAIRVIRVNQGLPGRDGAAGGFKFIHTQTAANEEWIVNHNLGEKPMAEIRNSGGQVIDAEVLHISVNQLRIYFSFALSGEVRCL